MNNQRLTDLTINETDVIASRRKFLTRMAYGSLLAVSGTGIAEAAAKHIVSSPAHSKKVDVKHTSKADVKHASKVDVKHASKIDSKHTTTTTAHTKSSLHDRLALKTANKHHAAHQELASNNSRIHSSLHNDHNGHKLHSDLRQQLALRDTNIHSRHSLRPADHRLHTEMSEFALQQDDLDLDTGFQNNRSNPFASRNTARIGGNATHKTIALQNTTTGDSLNVTYFEKGRYLPDALHEINHLYRDHLTDEVHPVDTALLDQLHELQSTLGIQRQIHVICGYRSPFTNAHLRRNSRGVARNSLHMEGRAIDIRISGVESRTIRDAAMSMARGGVGYYPGSNFVHLDTGDFRTW